MKPFLTAEWRQLVLINYAIDPDLLAPFVPAGTTLDLHHGRCYASLVGFLFQNTRLRGIPIPFHRTFEEVNLRYYVLRRDERSGEVKRGVAFIQEIVPLPAVTAIARWIYGEPYHTRRMRHAWRIEGDTRTTGYSWKDRGRWNVLEVTAATKPVDIAVGSEEEFITEHYWGYIRLGPQRSREYEVRHPQWKVHPVHSHHVDVDFGACYGERFSHLTGQEPASVMLAGGFEVSVWPRIIVSL